jgi:hypothetical protein
MQGQAGDWRVHDGDRSWSVRAPEFEATYEAAGEGRWRRRGWVLAAQARHSMTIDTLEGRALANRGDWVVEGSGGERWVVPDDHFRRAYEPDR